MKLRTKNRVLQFAIILVCVLVFGSITSAFSGSATKVIEHVENYYESGMESLGGANNNIIVDFSEGISVDGTTVIDGDGNYDGAITSSTGSFSSTLGVTGATTLGSTLGVTGATTLSSTLGVTGNTTLAGTLGVTGTSTLGVLSAATSTVSTTLGVTGATTLSSTLGVTGESSLNELTFGNGAYTASVATNTVLTAAQLCDNGYMAITPTDGAVNMTTPTAAQLIADCIPDIGNTTSLYYANEATGATSTTIVAGSNIDLVSDDSDGDVISQNGSALMTLVNLDGTNVAIILEPFTDAD